MSAAPHSSSQARYPEELVACVLDDAVGHDCRVYAVAGLQGTGKSTLAAQITALAATRGLRAVALSIDDFYLGHAERERLGHDIHPLCATRGAPGTHDIALACDVLDGLREGRATALPRFDKISDARLPRDRWPLARGADLIIFDGWCLKVPPQTDDDLIEPVNTLEREEDPHAIWRRWSNTALARDYPPLWSRLQRMLFLQGPGFEIVPQWRWQQEQTLQAAHPDRKAMTHAQVLRFVQFFERVSRQALRTLPDIAGLGIGLDAQRRVVKHWSA